VVPFSFRKVRTQRDAIDAAAAGGRYIAGGTTLIDLMREEVEQPGHLVDINALPMRGIRVTDTGLTIGSLARMAEVAAHPQVAQLQPLIVEALLESASPQIRNMASIGGNLMQRVRCPYFRMLDAACNKRVPGSGCSALEGINDGCAILGTSNCCVAAHPSDLAVALVALDAIVRVDGPRGERVFLVEDLYRLPGDTPHLEHAIEPAELIIEVQVPNGTCAQRARFLKVRERSSYEFALVSVAAALHVDGGVIRAARIAVGGVGTRPWRMRKSEQVLVGKAPGRPVFRLAADLALDGIRRLPGNRYKADLMAHTIVRALEMTGDVLWSPR
jgi:xanthine dehydrogenase YagS FAD-binding subunit